MLPLGSIIGRHSIAYINSSCIYGVFITRCKLLDTFRNRKVRLYLQQSPHSFKADFWPDETKMEGQQNDEKREALKAFQRNVFISAVIYYSAPTRIAFFSVLHTRIHVCMCLLQSVNAPLSSLRIYYWSF